MGARRSDEDCLVAVVGTGGSNVDHCLVHAHSADDIVEVVVDNYLCLVRQRTSVPICVANRQGYHSGGVLGCPGAAVTDGIPSFYYLEIDDFAPP